MLGGDIAVVDQVADAIPAQGFIGMPDGRSGGLQGQPPAPPVPVQAPADFPHRLVSRVAQYKISASTKNSLTSTPLSPWVIHQSISNGGMTDQNAS